MNILIDQATAEVVHIDLGVAFEQGLMLKTPERVCLYSDDQFCVNVVFSCSRFVDYVNPIIFSRYHSG